MFFLLFMELISIDSQMITHNCNISNINCDIQENKLIDYYVSCNSKQIQIINISKVKGIKSISINDNSNVIITCDDKKINQMKLSIYDTPTITFENHCYFSDVEIYDSPKFNLFENSLFLVDTIHLYNYSFEFPFHYKNIIYGKRNNQRQNIKEYTIKEAENEIYECNDMIFEGILNDNYVTFKCGNSFEYTLFYSSLHDNIFKLQYQNIILENKCSTQKIDNAYMAAIISSLNCNGKKKNITFTKTNIDAFINNTLKYFNNDHIWINDQVNGASYCLWSNEYEQKYLFETGLRKVCANSNAFYYCCDSDKGQRNIINISFTESLIILLTIIFSIIGIVISLLIITLHRHKKFNKIAQDNQSNELDSIDTSSSKSDCSDVNKND